MADVLVGAAQLSIGAIVLWAFAYNIHHYYRRHK